ncbi:alpha/beta fold hydrolase [Rhodococcus sp. (in: high G+C Gram-positive bacteria)]|uniref:alpha/beta fold hydrolase n=1 Tax=Rhodococcus sp. TaxID=1831 RepID=UPI003F0307D9
MESTMVTTDSGSIEVRVDGPDSRHSVLLLPDAGQGAGVFDSVCERLHNSDLRTIVPETLDGLTPDGVFAVLDQLSLPWVHLAGIGAGAEMAWTVASGRFGRFASLVVVDRGHPVVPMFDGAVRDASAPVAEVPTTIVIGDPARKPEADASMRYVTGEFRVVDLGSIDNVPARAAAEFASAIALRTGSW